MEAGIGRQRAWHKAFAADLIPGLTTAAVVVPKALAYATIAQLPVQAGLFAALVPMAVYAALGTSRLLSVSTTTPIAILCATAIGEALRSDPGLDPLTAAATLSLLVGLMLLAARVLRMGFLASFISEPVLTGFKAGVGFVIVVDQVPKLLGIHIHKEGFFRDVASIFAHAPELSWNTLAVALGTLAVIFFAKRYLPKSPAPLLAVAVGIAASAVIGLEAAGVSVVGSIQGGFPVPQLPQPSLFEAMWPAAAGIALISFTESIAAARAFERPADPPIDANRELLAVGAANAAGAFIGSMPAGGGTSQTAVALKAGAQTQAASLVVAAAAFATLLFLAPLIELMPHATLAAVVIAYSVGLISPQEMVAIRRVRTMEFRWAVAACLGVMVLGTLKGIVVAIVLSLLGLMYLAYDPRVYALRRMPGTNVFRPHSPKHPEDEAIPGLLIARPEDRLYFGNAANVGAKLQALAEAADPKVILLDCSAIPGFEYTALKMLVEGEARQREQGRELWLAALNPEALELVRRTPLAERLGPERMFHTSSKRSPHSRRAGSHHHRIAMSQLRQIEQAVREPLLHPVDRVSEMIFGLFMALTFVGVVSMATAGREEVRTMLIAALGCNLAWGLVDAFMYLVRTITERGRLITLTRSIREADAEIGRRLLQEALSPQVAKLMTATEIEAMRGRLLAQAEVPARPRLMRDDFLAALAVFLIVVASTFPVALPFVFIQDSGTALFVSRAIGLAMMFLGGLALGRYAGYGSWRTGFMMAGLGTVVIAIVVALGG